MTFNQYIYIYMDGLGTDSQFFVNCNMFAPCFFQNFIQVGELFVWPGCVFRLAVGRPLVSVTLKREKGSEER